MDTFQETSIRNSFQIPTSIGLVYVVFYSHISRKDDPQFLEQIRASVSVMDCINNRTSDIQNSNRKIYELAPFDASCASKEIVVYVIFRFIQMS